MVAFRELKRPPACVCLPAWQAKRSAAGRRMDFYDWFYQYKSNISAKITVNVIPEDEPDEKISVHLFVTEKNKNRL